MALKKILANLNSPLKSQIETLCDVVDSLQQKLIENEEQYMAEPLSVTIMKKDGEVTYRTNPFLEQYRSTLRDYGQALTKLKELVKNDLSETTLNDLNELRDKFKLML